MQFLNILYYSATSLIIFHSFVYFFNNAFVFEFDFSFSFLFLAVLPLRFHLSCGKSVKYRFTEVYVFDFGSLPYFLSLFFWSGVTLPLVAVYEINE